MVMAVVMRAGRTTQEAEQRVQVTHMSAGLLHHDGFKAPAQQDPGNRMHQKEPPKPYTVPMTNYLMQG